MDMVFGLLVGLGLCSGGVLLVWKMHAIGALLGIGLLLCATGLCAVIAAFMGADVAMIGGGVASVAVLLGAFWVMSHMGH